MFFEMENNTTENSLYNWQRIPTGDFYTVLQRYSTGMNHLLVKNIEECYLFICVLYSTQVHAQAAIERIVDGIVERCDTLKYAKTPVYLYTTVESRDSVRVLLETHEPTTYELLFPKLPDSANENKRLQDFRESLYASFCRIGNVEQELAGKRLALLFYIKSDGSVVCRHVGLTSLEKLPDYISSNEIRQMVDVINTYRFKPSEITRKHYMFSGVVIQFRQD